MKDYYKEIEIKLNKIDAGYDKLVPALSAYLDARNKAYVDAGLIRTLPKATNDSISSFGRA